MKTLITVLLVLTLTVTSFAASYTTVGFRAYSTATPVSCAVAQGVQATDGTFTADSITMLSLGNKGTGAVTPVWNRDLKVTCGKTVDGSAIIVKLFFDTEGTNVFPMSSFLLRVK